MSAFGLVRASPPLLQTRFKLRRFISLTLRLVPKRRLNFRLTPDYAAQTSTLSLPIFPRGASSVSDLFTDSELTDNGTEYVVSRSFCNKSWRIERLFRDISSLAHGCLPFCPYKSRVLYLSSPCCFLFRCALNTFLRLFPRCWNSVSSFKKKLLTGWPVNPVACFLLTI